VIDTVYGMRPSGHGALLQRTHGEPNHDLVMIFSEWWERNNWSYLEYDRGYDSALAALEGKAVTMYDGHSMASPLLFNSEISDSWFFGQGLGIFMSAIYARCQEQIIEYPFDTPWLGYLGFRLEKALINHGNAGYGCANKMSGTFLNLGTVGAHAGHKAKGVLINSGIAGEAFGWDSEGLLVNLGTAEDEIGKGIDGFFLNAGDTKSYAGAFPRSSRHLVVANIGTTGWRMGQSMRGGILINAGNAGEYFAENSSTTLVTLDEPASIKSLTLSYSNYYKSVDRMREYLAQIAACAKETPLELGKRYTPAGISAHIHSMLAVSRSHYEVLYGSKPRW
jgi:hypothetical protein